MKKPLLRSWGVIETVFAALAIGFVIYANLHSEKPLSLLDSAFIIIGWTFTIYVSHCYIDQAD